MPVSMYPRDRGLTIVELLAVLMVIVVVLLVFLPSIGRVRTITPPLKDSTQVRGILQAMVIHAQNNQDRFPLPSILDAGDHTIAGGGTAKDHTANIFSMLISDGSISTEILISPAESNGNIWEFEGYEFDEPSAAADPASALWDPAFSADFTNGEGNISYAHLLPGGPRQPLWANTFNSAQSVIANRGPKITGVTYTGKDTTPAFDAMSNTLLIHGGRNTWEGNVGYADNHVSFENELAPASASPFTDAQGTKRPDAIHYNEPNDPADLNAFLSIFTTAGDNTADFTAIWD